MNLFNKIILIAVANFVSLVLSRALLPGFHITANLVPALVVVGILTAAHILILPIVKAILSPLIILTLGLFSLVINALVLYIVDIYSQSITMDNLATLALATLIFVIANTIILVLAKLGTK